MKLRYLLFLLVVLLWARPLAASDIGSCGVTGPAGATGDLTAAATDVIGDADDTYDLGSTTYEFKDLFLDGTAHIDTLDVDIDGAIAGVLTTTDIEGLDLDIRTGGSPATALFIDSSLRATFSKTIQFNTTELGIAQNTADGSDSKTTVVCGGGGETGCDAEGRGAWLKVEGVDVGGANVGGAVFLEGAAGDATSDVTVASNHDDADVIVRGGSTQATIATFDAGTKDVILAAGHLDLETTGKTLILEDGTAASTCIGNATANGTTAVVTATTCVEAGDYIFISRTSAPSGTAQCFAGTIIADTSFELDCDGAETGTFHWIVIKGQ